MSSCPFVWPNPHSPHFAALVTMAQEARTAIERDFSHRHPRESLLKIIPEFPREPFQGGRDYLGFEVTPQSEMHCLVTDVTGRLHHYFWDFVDKRLYWKNRQNEKELAHDEPPIEDEWQLI